jgi:hypothetical protein
VTDNGDGRVFRSSMKHGAQLLVFIFMLPVVGCEEPLTVDCITRPFAGLRVTVVDSLTESPPSEASLIATSPGFTDSTGPVQPISVRPTQSVLVLYAVHERQPGIYSVLVRSPGYRNWLRNGVEVTADVCHVRTVALTARLQISQRTRRAPLRRRLTRA